MRILLHPPLLRALGLKRKLELRAAGCSRCCGCSTARGGCAARAWTRSAASKVRRTERALIEEYRSLVGAALEHLTPRTAGQVEAIAELPEVVRGYEEIKLAAVEDFRLQARAMSENLAAVAGRSGGSPRAARDPQGQPAVQGGGVLR